jgi:hypothetical protein
MYSVALVSLFCSVSSTEVLLFKGFKLVIDGVILVLSVVVQEVLELFPAVVKNLKLTSLNDETLKYQILKVLESNPAYGHRKSQKGHKVKPH